MFVSVELLMGQEAYKIICREKKKIVLFGVTKGSLPV